MALALLSATMVLCSGLPQPASPQTASTQAATTQAATAQQPPPAPPSGPAQSALEAASQPPAPLQTPFRWSVRIEPSYWYAAPRGDITLPSSIGDVTLGDATFARDSDVNLTVLDADDPGSQFAGRVHVADGLWRFSLAGVIVASDADATADAPGRVGDAFFAPDDHLDSSFDFWSFEATAAYAIIHGPQPGERGDPARLRYALEVLAGARIEGVDFSLDVTPASGARPPELGNHASGRETFAQPIAGARLTLDLLEDVAVEVGGSLGYFTWTSVQTSSTWDILAAISWRPVENVGLQFGYRYLGLSGDSGDDEGEAFEFRGSTAGLFAGIVVQF